MKKKIRIKNPVIICVALILGYTGCKQDRHSSAPGLELPTMRIAKSETLVIPAEVSLPANLPNGNERVTTLFASGIQHYRAMPKAGTNPVEFEWVFIEPFADLFDKTNKHVGSHSIGPTWQLSPADSIYGQVFTPAKFAPSPDDPAKDLDWLLLMPKAGKTPTGIFAGVAYIQRIATIGGKAPVTPPIVDGQIADVTYTAVYRFSRIK